MVDDVGRRQTALVRALSAKTPNLFFDGSVVWRFFYRLQTLSSKQCLLTYLADRRRRAAPDVRRLGRVGPQPAPPFSPAWPLSAKRSAAGKRQSTLTTRLGRSLLGGRTGLRPRSQDPGAKVVPVSLASERPSVVPNQPQGAIHKNSFNFP